MRESLLPSWLSPATLLLLLLAACSNIIGVSDYEVDRTLDESGSGSSDRGGSVSSGGNAPNAGEANAGDASATTGGDGTSAGGVAPSAAGTASAGGIVSAGGSPPGGEGTGGDTAPGGCSKAQDCDDTIDCTVDTCGRDGTCIHTPDNTVCLPLAGDCATCTVGIGCVERPGTVRELLLDPGFDIKSGDWIDYRDGLPASIVADATAQTPGNSVRLGPAANAATEQGFTDLSQQVTIPKNATALVVSGYYKLIPGKAGDQTRDAAEDYTTLTLFSLADENDDYTRYVDYHQWYGDDAAQSTWKSFTYSTPKVVLREVLDQVVTLDLVTETWDTRFMFDSLSLQVTTCE